MRHGSGALVLLLSLVTLAGCVTPYAQGRAALRQGRYDEAAGFFQEVLAGEPDRLEALAGLGASRYKLGALAEAAEALERVIAQAPANPEARLYLGLTYLQRGEDGFADEQLTALRAQRPEPRIAAQIDRALQLIRFEPLSDSLRAFIAASLEDEAEWSREVQEARLEAYSARRYAYLSPYRCFRARHGLRCF